MAEYSAKYALAKAQVLWDMLLSELSFLPSEYNGFSDKERDLLISLTESCEQDFSTFSSCFPLEVTYDGSKIAE